MSASTGRRGDAAGRLDRLSALGQSVWLDFIRRGHLRSGEFERLVRERAVVGVTSNPTIFHQAITAGDDYDSALVRGVARGLTAEALFEALAIEDIQMACDLLRPVHQRTGGLDGRVSIEVDPRLAGDAEATVREARRLSREVSRPNLMVKIPATEAGLAAIAAATADGICVNVTLIFSLARYAQVMDAYLEGLERRVAKGLPLEPVFSVASFFVSRVDTAVDRAIDEAAAKRAPDDPARAELEGLRGRAAVANARLAYVRFAETFDSPRFRALRERGAHPQRPLWASTGTKNPAYPDTLYVDELIAADSVNTMPPQTLEAFADHGTAAEATIGRDLPQAAELFRRLPALGVPVEELIGALEAQGVAAFARSQDALIEALEARRRAAHGRRWVSPRFSAGDAADAVRERLAAFDREGFARRLWARDAALWGGDAARHAAVRARLGWLDSTKRMQAEIGALEAFAAEARRERFTHAVLLGMGGSSLAPEVMRSVFDVRSRSLELAVLDSTSPAAVRAVTARHQPDKTLLLVASKSGTTVEVASLEKHFFEWVRASRAEKSGQSFAAITDAGTPLEALASARGYRRTFLNPPDIGGRYSALSFFGLVPAALIGVDLSGLLEHALDEARASGAEIAAEQNFGLKLGAALGELALRGRDKVTLALGPEIAAFGDWVEQLLAESTGKDGKGLVPVAGEPLGDPDAYGDDRVFVAWSVNPFPRETEARLDALERAGHPVLRWRDLEPTAIGAEFLRWEIATAAAAAVIGVNPFDEPNVTEAKEATRTMLERRGAAAAAPGDVSVEATQAVADAIGSRAGGRGDAGAWAAALLTLARPGDYFALHAYFQRTPARHERLERLRLAARGATRLATTLGYGPRFLHSTGQLHKGGPATGLFLQLTADEGDELAIPGEPHGFGALLRAQAAGDYGVLERRGRRVMRIHLGAEPEKALDEIIEAVAAARV